MPFVIIDTSVYVNHWEGVGHFETQALSLQVSASEQSLKENTDGVSSGNLLEVASLTQKANLLQAKQTLR